MEHRPDSVKMDTATPEEHRDAAERWRGKLNAARERAAASGAHDRIRDALGIQRAA